MTLQAYHLSDYQEFMIGNQDFRGSFGHFGGKFVLSPRVFFSLLEIKIEFSVFLQSIGENEYGKTGHSKIFTFLRHL